MTLFESLLVSINGFGIVFSVLIVLCFFVVIQTYIVKLLEKKALAPATQSIEPTPVIETASKVIEDVPGTIYTDELKLLDVDEKTAAMIMAIVSDQSQIPLSQLIFKSIKAMD